MAEIKKGKETFPQNFATAFRSTTNLLSKELNAYDLPRIDANQGNTAY